MVAMLLLAAPGTARTVNSPQPLSTPGDHAVLRHHVPKKTGLFRQIRAVTTLKKQLRKVAEAAGREGNGATLVVAGLVLGCAAPLILLSPALTLTGFLIAVLLAITGLVFSIIGYAKATSGWSRGAKWIKVVGIIGIILDGLVSIALLGILLILAAFGL
jgi:hypothetical protein